MLALDFCRKIPKVELHVHLEGSIRPETVLKLALKNKISLPADTVAGLQDWYRFIDFPHFVQVYVAVSKCIQTPDDLELITREFLEGQAKQNVLHTEFTYSASTIARHVGIPWKDQHAALLRAMEFGAKELDITSGIIIDIVRGDSLEGAMEVAGYAVGSEGVVAIGLAGEETRGTAQYRDAIVKAVDSGLPFIPHAGETCGPESIWECLNICEPARIEHGVRCLEDRDLTKTLVSRAIPLDICPTSNVALGVYKSLEEHPLPALLDEGLFVTINSDDPPMFGTTISDEFFRCSEAFDFDEDIAWSLCLNSANASMLPADSKRLLVSRMRAHFAAVRTETVPKT